MLTLPPTSRYNPLVSRSASSVVFVVCLSILAGAFGVALGMHYRGSQPVGLADVRSGSSLNIARTGHLPAASTVGSDDALDRDAVAVASTPDVASLWRIAELEAENARLQSELGAARFASML